MVGPCSLCGPFSQYCTHQSGASYWPMQNQQQVQQYPYYNTNNSSSYDDYDETDYMYSSSSSSSPYSSVDCTLSLGTPSTRLTNQNTNTTPHRNSVSSFCWDLLHPKQSSASSTKTTRSNNHATASAGVGGGSDPLFVRRCANCDTTSTPLWRNGPRGPKSLCNACGIRFKKEERRAAAATTTAAANNVAASGMMDPHNGYYNGSWAHQHSQGTQQKMQCFGSQNEFRFLEDENGSDSSIQFLSWLTHDRPSGLVHDFTR